MTEAAARAPSLAGPTWILARRQTDARGRRGRAWQSPTGNFAATLVMRPEGGPAQAALRSFVAALALQRALTAYVAPARLALKWPNDVLLDGGKVAGILLESAGAPGEVAWLSIGIGINLVAAPPPEMVEADALTPVSLAGQGDAAPTPDEMLTVLARQFAELETTFGQFGFDPIRRAWLDHAARLGQPIRARTAKAELIGTFLDMDNQGQLVLETAKGRTVIPAADVFF